MPETISAVRTPPAASVGGAEGRAKGALICAFFGSVWMFWAAAFVPTARPAALAFVAAITTVIVGWAISRVRAVRHREKSAADRQRWASIAPLYWLNTAAEWLLVAGSVIALAHYRRYALIPQAVGVIIGMHFLVLAKLIKEPRYYIMGAAMIFCVLASLHLHEGSLRNVIACAGLGLPMWITALVILFHD